MHTQIEKMLMVMMLSMRSIDAQNWFAVQTEIHVCNFIPNHVRKCAKKKNMRAPKRTPRDGVRFKWINKYIGLAWNMHLVAPLAVANHSMYETIMFIQCNRWLPSDCAHTHSALFCFLLFEFNFVCLHKTCSASDQCFFFQFFQFTSNLSAIGLLSSCLCMACLVFHSQIDLDVFALLHFICWSIRVRFCCSFTSRFRSRQINDFGIVNNL